jgi:hypothetical protein
MILRSEDGRRPRVATGGCGRPVMHTVPSPGRRQLHITTVLRFEPPWGHGSSLSKSLVLHELCPRKSFCTGPWHLKEAAIRHLPAAGASGLLSGPVAGFDSSQSHASFVQINLNIREHEWWIFAGEEGLSNTKREGFNSKSRLMNRGGARLPLPCGRDRDCPPPSCSGIKVHHPQKGDENSGIRARDVGGPGTLYTVPPLTHSPNHPIG